MIREVEGKKTLQVLSLEDSPLDAELLREYLLEHEMYTWDITSVDQERPFLEALNQRTYDVILADYMIPGYGGFQALKAAKAICPMTPFICVSGSIGEDMAVELLKQGATDYVLKDKMARLIYSIEGALARVEEERQLKEY